MKNVMSLLLFLCTGIVARGQDPDWYVNPMALHVWTDTVARARDVPGLVSDIDRIDEVDFEQVGFLWYYDPAKPLGHTPQYLNFLKLREIATTEQLVELMSYPSGPVRCYAAWALMDRHYPDFAEVFMKLVNKDLILLKVQDCTEEHERLTDLVYERLREHFDSITPFVDSIVIFTHHLNTSVLRSVLGRPQPERYLPRIEFLAFTWNRAAAILYLYRLHRPAYENTLHEAAFTYLHRANLRATEGLQGLLKILLDSHNTELNEQIYYELKTQGFTKKNDWALNALLVEYGLSELP